MLKIHGRNYFVLEKLSHRGTYRVFDPRARPGGDYRALHRIPLSKFSRQKMEILKRLTGPTANRNFPNVVECVRQRDEQFVIVAWVWGTNLKRLLADIRAEQIPRPSAYEIVRLFRGLAHGLAHYYRKANLIHGDISPANIVLTSGTQNLVMVDFGSAWPIERSARKEVGDGITLPYAAPERLGNHAPHDFRADQFSLTAVAYELLTLEIPFDGLGGTAGTLQQFGSDSIALQRPSSLIPSVRRYPRASIKQLDTVFTGSLALRSNDRYPTPRAWLQAWDDLYFSMRAARKVTWMEQACYQFLAKIRRNKYSGDVPHSFTALHR